jgi:hypothetical protein
MFVVSEADAAAIRTAFDHGGELSTAVELRHLEAAAGEAPDDQAAGQAAAVADPQSLV